MPRLTIGVIVAALALGVTQYAHAQSNPPPPRSVEATSTRRTNMPMIPAGEHAVTASSTARGIMHEGLIPGARVREGERASSSPQFASSTPEGFAPTERPEMRDASTTQAQHTDEATSTPAREEAHGLFSLIKSWFGIHASSSIDVATDTSATSTPPTAPQSFWSKLLSFFR